MERFNGILMHIDSIKTFQEVRNETLEFLKTVGEFNNKKYTILQIINPEFNQFIDGYTIIIKEEDK